LRSSQILANFFAMRVFVVFLFTAGLVIPSFADDSNRPFANSSEEAQERQKERAEEKRAELAAERAERNKEREPNRIKATKANPKEGLEINSVQGSGSGGQGKGVFSYEEYQARFRKKADEDRARIEAARQKKDAERAKERAAKEKAAAGKRMTTRKSKADLEKEASGGGLDYLRSR
jgi:hypothetical protein